MTATKAQLKNRKTFYSFLRSGVIPQTKGRLLNNKGACCLGVACEVVRQLHPHKFEWSDMHCFIIKSDDEYYRRLPPPKLLEEYFGFEEANPRLVGETVLASTLNDKRGYSFAMIADAFEKVYPVK